MNLSTVKDFLKIDFSEKDLDDLKKQLGNQLGSFTYNLKQEKVIDFLKANNNL